MGYPTSYTSNQILKDPPATDAAGSAQASRELNASSENPGTFEINAFDDWISATLAVRPAAAGVTVPIFDRHYRSMRA